MSKNNMFLGVIGDESTPTPLGEALGLFHSLLTACNGTSNCVSIVDEELVVTPSIKYNILEFEALLTDNISWRLFGFKSSYNARCFISRYKQELRAFYGLIQELSFQSYHPELLYLGYICTDSREEERLDRLLYLFFDIYQEVQRLNDLHRDQVNSYLYLNVSIKSILEDEILPSNISKFTWFGKEYALYPSVESGLFCGFPYRHSKPGLNVLFRKREDAETFWSNKRNEYIELLFLINE